MWLVSRSDKFGSGLLSYLGSLTNVVYVLCTTGSHNLLCDLTLVRDRCVVSTENTRHLLETVTSCFGEREVDHNAATSEDEDVER